jgi:hypothetical protein
MDRIARRVSPHGLDRIRLFATLVAAALAAWILAGPARASSTVPVFSTDFQSGFPAEFTAHQGAVIEDCQGFSGLGPSGNQFGGNFLHYTAVTIYPTTLTLTSLPAHDHVDIDFLLALIDSWDGTELLQIRVDGALLFNHWFQLATGDASSYTPLPGGLLSSGTNLGFSNGGYWFRDRAYNMAVEPAFHGIAHSSSTLTVEWTISAVSGTAADQWQGGTDESWGLDNVRVSVINSLADAEPSSGPNRLGLAGTWPNPARRGALAVRFSLPSDRPASLEIFDTSGRRVVNRDVGALGPGAHSIELSGESHLRPGVYLIRLSQDGDSKSGRAVVLE